MIKCMISFISFAYTKQILAAKRWRTSSFRSWQEQEDAFDLQHRGVDLEPQEFLGIFFSARGVTNVDTSLWESQKKHPGKWDGIYSVFSGSSIMFKYLQCTASTDRSSQQWYIGKSENLNTF